MSPDVVNTLSPAPERAWETPLRYRWPTCTPNEEIEKQLDAICRDAARLIPPAIGESRLDGIVLGGGYGRGEGGVLHTPEGDRLYNDVEFYVLVRDPLGIHARRWQEDLHQIGEELTEKHRIDVEFHLFSKNKLKRSQPSMFFYDLVLGHRVVWGPADILRGCAHHTNPAAIPLHEATRLLMNRATGLLLAKNRLQKNSFSQEDADFVYRNLAKAKLAMGDALLTVLGRYHWSCRERGRVIAEWPFEIQMRNLAEIQRLHQAGVEFKLTPIKSSHSRESLWQEWREVSGMVESIWFFIEERRLKRSWADRTQYSIGSTNKCPEAPAWKCVLSRVKVWKKRALGFPLFRHPRHHVLNALPLLLWEEKPLENPALKCCLEENLRTPLANETEAVEAYRQIWQRVN